MKMGGVEGTYMKTHTHIHTHFEQINDQNLATPQRGCQHMILLNFPKNCMKLKEFGRPRGGSASLVPPPPSPPIRQCTPIAKLRFYNEYPTFRTMQVSGRSNTLLISDCTSHAGVVFCIVILSSKQCGLSSIKRKNLKNTFV